MLQLNNYKLISPTTWGEILGQITDQEDLMKLLQNDTNDLKEWVESKNYLTEHQSLEDYALKSEIPSLEGYALKSEIPSLEGYATESWVEGKGYLTEHQDLTAYALTVTVDAGYNNLQTQINTINTTIGEMETITNEILA